MPVILFLTFKSMLSRKFTTLLCLISIALSVALFLGIERMRNGAKEGFTNTLSQTDLIVGARGGSLQLLLYSIFHIGNATNNVRYSSLEHFQEHPLVRWIIPISLGDSYRGHRVVGTNENFFQYYQFRGDQHLQITQGRIFEDIFDVVIGHEVATKFNLQLNDPITLAHGLTTEAILEHTNTPFRIVGILAPTQTPVDKALYISLYGMEAMHIGWESGMPREQDLVNPAILTKEDLQIQQVTAFLVGARNRVQVLRLRSEISQFTPEPLMAIIPGMILQELWQTMGQLEQVLILMSFFVLSVGLIGILISLYYSVQERRKEMAILRSLGAGHFHLIGLLLSESLTLVILGSAMGISFLFMGLWALKPKLEQEYSLYLELSALQSNEWSIIALVIVAGLIAGVIPAIKAALNSLQDGLNNQN
jgi:putative ABC transport system permease protein